MSSLTAGAVDRYAEYVPVEDVQYLVKVPAEVPMPVASMLPSGGLWAMNSVFTARQYVEKLMKERGDSGEQLTCGRRGGKGSRLDVVTLQGRGRHEIGRLV